MEHKTFEELAKLVASGVPRRTVLKRAVGGALAGLFALRGGQTLAQPGCRQEGHPCEGNQECCPGLVCRVTGPGNAERCARPPKTTTTKKPNKTTTTTKKPNKTTTTTKKPKKY